MRRSLLPLLLLSLSSAAQAQAPTLIVEYRAASPHGQTESKVRVMSDGRIDHEEGYTDHSSHHGSHHVLSAADLARVRVAVAAARSAPRPQRHVGATPPRADSASLNIPGHAAIRWVAGDTAPPAVIALRDLLLSLEPVPPMAAVAPDPVSSGPPGGGADS